MSKSKVFFFLAVVPTTGTPNASDNLSKSICIFFFLASPLPWYWRGINDIIAFLFSAFFYTISIYYSFKAIKLTSKNKNIIICLLIFAISSAFIYSWGVSNAGTALRHRDKFLPNFILLFIIASDAIVSKRLQLGSKQ